MPRPRRQGLERQKVRPEAAFYHPELKEFILLYDAVREADSPERMLLEFLQSTYEAAANLGAMEQGRAGNRCAGGVRDRMDR